ncbi:hypothetical protein BJX70DRAFT_402853 [Aspergillus crustosus]
MGALYTVTIVTIGFVRPFLGGVGTLEAPSVVREYEENNPGIFGRGGGLNRVLSLTDVSAALGQVGPILAGALVEWVGYTIMNLVFSEFAVWIVGWINGDRWDFAHVGYAGACFLAIKSRGPSGK